MTKVPAAYIDLGKTFSTGLFSVGVQMLITGQLHLRRFVQLVVRAMSCESVFCKAERLLLLNSRTSRAQ